MKISILISNKEHPIYPYLEKWVSANASYEVELLSGDEKAQGGDLLFLVSYLRILDSEVRSKYKKVLVLHASDLPLGRGMNPHVWQILEGKDEIVVSLFEAEDELDSGKIWAKKNIYFGGHELFDEINHKLFSAELSLMDFAIANFTTVVPENQLDLEPTYYPKRHPEDSEIDVTDSLQNVFNVLRVADPVRYPAYFKYKGHTYFISLKKKILN